MYIAQKPVRFSGRDFLIGDEIPAELVDRTKVPQLIKQRIIAEAPKEAEHVGVAKIAIPVRSAEGDLMLELDNDALVSVTDVLQGTSAEAETIISGITSMDALILIDACDHRKGVQQMAKDRAAVITEEAEGEEETAGDA